MLQTAAGRSSTQAEVLAAVRCDPVEEEAIHMSRPPSCDLHLDPATGSSDYDRDLGIKDDPGSEATRGLDP